MKKITAVLSLCVLVPALSFAQPDETHPALVHSEFVYQEAPFPSCHASTIEEVRPGEFLCAFFGGTSEGQPDVAIWMSRLADGDWSEPHEVIRHEGVPTWNPVLFQMPDDELLLFYKAGPHTERWTTYLKRSTDAGETWSDAEMLPGGIMGPSRAKPILLEDGTLLCGSEIVNWHNWTVWMDSSPDRGRTWHKHGPIFVPNQGFHVIQPTLFYDQEGNIRMVCRSRSPKRICTAISHDEGKTWSMAQPTELPNPSSGIDAVNLPDGRVALIYNHSTDNRHNLSIAISEDGGDTWQAEALILENEPGEFSYPAMIVGEDGNLHATYTWNRERIKYVVIDPDQL